MSRQNQIAQRTSPTPPGRCHRALLATVLLLNSGFALVPIVARGDGGADLSGGLREGGRILAFAAAGVDANGSGQSSSASDCRAPANLSEPNQDDAKALGDGFRNLELRFDQVYSGVACRTRHTAFLALGADWVRFREQLDGGCGADGAALPLDLLSGTAPRTGHNHVVFTQACRLRADLRQRDHDCANPIGPGDAVVYSLDGGVLGCISRQQWRAWAAQPHWSQRLEPVSRFPFQRFE